MLFGKGIEIGPVILQHMRQRRPVLRRQPPGKLGRQFGRARRAPGCGQPGPQRGAKPVHSDTPARSVAARKPQLGKRMALVRRPPPPLHGPPFLARQQPADTVEIAQQKLCLRIAGARQRFGQVAGRLPAAVLEMIARAGKIGLRRMGQKKKPKVKNGLAHAALLLSLSEPLSAEPLTEADFPEHPPALVKLGRLLFADPILSGNRDIACITCHDPTQGTSDGVALNLGAGARGQGMARSGPIRQRQSRNAPGLWSLGARQMRVFFWDGRVEQHRTGLRSGAGDRLPAGLSGPLAAQTLFPLIAATEMAGLPGSNEIADAPGATAAWAALVARVNAAPRYRMPLRAAFGTPHARDIAALANALAAYIGVAFAGTGTAYDRFATGEASALSDRARRGHELFFGRAGCAGCHSGPLFTDQKFHALGVPQFGPGRSARFDPVARDTGRAAITGDPRDAYRFRTPPLRGVALTAPYGHTGAFADLAAMIRHHADPRASRRRWQARGLLLPHSSALVVPDLAALEDTAELSRQEAAISIRPIPLTEPEIRALVAFLEALTPPLPTP